MMGSRPHLVHVLADDLGWASVGWHRSGNASADVRTPVLDKLVASGVELDRFYTHQICSPSRCAIQSGRAPIHVNVQNVLPEVTNPADPVGGYQGLPINMTGMASVLRRGGYRTHLVGKWDVGMATELHHPRARGYESWLGYWHHANDYWQQTVGSCGLLKAAPRDLWRLNATFDGPAAELANGPSCSESEQSPAGEECTYEEALLISEVLRVIEQHNTSEPLFLFWAPHLVHMPLQVPTAVLQRFSFISDEKRRLAHAMANYLDTEVGQVVGALQQRDMWDNTLFVFHSDNGGEILFAGVCGGNNWPLTGGKFSNFEGGIRVPAFVTGGALPPPMRGTAQAGMVAAWDWYATYAHLAGVDPTDHAAAAAGLPPIDSINMWPYLSGTTTQSPRTRLVIGETSALTYNGDGHALVGGVLDADGYKLLLGPADKLHTISQYVMTGPSWPNRSSHLIPDLHPKTCGRHVKAGCLFNVFNDPSERHNLAQSMPDRFAAMLAVVDEEQQKVYSPVRGHTDARACDAANGRYGGYWGPFVS